MGHTIDSPGKNRSPLEGLAPVQTHTPRGDMLPAELLVEAMRELARARSRKLVAELATRAARRLVGADGATFIWRDGDQCLHLAEDAIAPLWKGQRFPLDACISGWVMRQGEQVAMADIYADSRIASDVYRSTFVKSLVMTPVRRLSTPAPEGRPCSSPLAAVGVYWADFHVARECELKLLQELSESAASALDHALAYEALERQVTECSDQLDHASKELEAMARTVSHDLRSPLNAIIGFAELLLEEQRSPAIVHSFADEIAGAGRRMNSLIGGLLDFARNARTALHKTDVDMSTLASKVVQQLRAQGEHPSLELIITPGMRAHVDAAQMEVALSRLFDNALKYSARSDPPRILFSKIDYEDGPSTFFVRDNGVGFDEALSARLFAPFQRLHSEQEFAGQGVGLATVSRIIMGHGGRVWAEGRPGEGATFSFSLQGCA